MSGIPDRLASALAERYRLERELGAGGMSAVCLAQDLKDDHKVAIKVVRPAQLVQWVIAPSRAGASLWWRGGACRTLPEPSPEIFC